MSLIRFREVSKRFDGRQVLRNAFFRLEPGERVGLIGGNGCGKTTVLRILELLQFSEMDLHQRIGTLSGGQKARVALALSVLSGALCVLLDEPTNHLDLKSTQVMERALANFPGAVVVVSHDRFFLDKVATRLIVFGRQQGSVDVVDGNWTTWSAAPGVVRP